MPRKPPQTVRSGGAGRPYRLVTALCAGVLLWHAPAAGLAATAWAVEGGAGATPSPTPQAATAHFRVYAEGTSGARAVAGWAEEAYRRMSIELDSRPPPTIIYIYGRASAFRAAAGPRPAGLRTAGLARPAQRVIWVDMTAGMPEITVRHEVAHTLLLWEVSHPWGIPPWFVEGLATYQARPGLEGMALERLALSQDVPALRELTRPGTPEDTDPARVAADGYLAVRFLVDKYGEAKLFRVARQVKRGTGFREAFVAVYGVEPSRLERSWREFSRAERESIYLSYLRDIAWMALPALLLVAVVVWKVKKRRRLSAMDDEDDWDDWPGG